MRISIFLLILVVVLLIIIAGGLFMITQPFVQAYNSLPTTVDSGRLEKHVRYLSEDLYPRSYEHLRNINLAAQYILDEFKTTGGEVKVQSYEVQGNTYKNIVVRFGPSSGPVMVIGAHYDSVGFAFTDSNGSPGFSPETHTPGADDNASGVAGLIELARLLGQAQQKRAIELVAYTLEEPPFFRTPQMGSARHAHSMRASNQEVEFMLSLEMIGYFTDVPGSQAYPVPGMKRLYPDRGNFIALVGKMSDFGATRRIKATMASATDLPVHSINAPPILQGVDFSDHLNYWNEGYPAFMITDTAFLRNANYHLAGDTYEKLDYERMAKVVLAVYAVTQQL